MNCSNELKRASDKCPIEIILQIGLSILACFNIDSNQFIFFFPADEDMEEDEETSEEDSDEDELDEDYDEDEDVDMGDELDEDEEEEMRVSKQMLARNKAAAAEAARRTKQMAAAAANRASANATKVIPLKGNAPALTGTLVCPMYRPQKELKQIYFS